MTLPKDKDKRKQMPIVRGVLDYFPDAIAEVAHVSYVGNEQHNPGEEMHWARGKSMDQEDCLVRHLMERGTLDSDGLRHSAKVAWRALALLQLEIEADKVTQLAKEAKERYERLIQHRVENGEYDVIDHNVWTDREDEVVELFQVDYPSKEQTR